MSDTTIVNMRNENSTKKIDRSTILGNPFRLKKDGGKYTREESVVMYAMMFGVSVKHSEPFREEVVDCIGEELGCWCYPEACHGDVIRKFCDIAERKDVNHAVRTMFRMSRDIAFKIGEFKLEKYDNLGFCEQLMSTRNR
jgi:hypothetical protein